MSIDLIDVSHAVKTKGGGHIALRDVNMHIEKGQRVALLGKKGSGLDEIVDIICGSSMPARGRVEIRSEISWPIGESGFMQGDRTLATNLRFISRIYEVDADEYIARVSELADLAGYWNKSLGSCDRDIRARFAFALGACLPFDIYIFDTPESQGDRDFQERINAVIAARAQEAGILIVSSKGAAALEHCQTGFVLDEGMISYYEDIEAAVAHLDRLLDKVTVEEGEDDSEDNESDEIFDII